MKQNNDEFQFKFWSKYEKADYFKKIELLQCCPPLENLQHKFIPEHKTIVFETIMEYLDDYKNYLTEKRK